MTYARRIAGRRSRRARAEPVPRRGGPTAVRGRHGGARPRRSSRPCAPRSRSRWRSSSARSTRRSPTSPRQQPDAGADGLVLFNRFYQPDLDLESIEVVPRLELEPAVGDAAAGPLDRRSCGRSSIPIVSLAATSGAHSGTDVAKGLMVGADVVHHAIAITRARPLRGVADRRSRAGTSSARCRSRPTGTGRARRAPTARPRRVRASRGPTPRSSRT